jgi:general secretion pathway protein N
VTKQRLIAFGGVLTLFFLILNLPLSLAVAASGLGGTLFSARKAEGSVWNGVLREVSIDGIPIGDVAARLSLWRLFRGHIALTLNGITDPGSRARLLASFASAGVDGLNTRIAAPAAFAPLPVSSLALTELLAELRGDRCVIAGGRIEAVVDGAVVGLPSQLILTGTPRCDGNAILAPLQSAGGAEQLRMRIAPNGQYSFRLRVRPVDTAVAERLRAVGFREGAAGFDMEATGRF